MTPLYHVLTLDTINTFEPDFSIKVSFKEYHDLSIYHYVWIFFFYEVPYIIIHSVHIIINNDTLFQYFMEFVHKKISNINELK